MRVEFSSLVEGDLDAIADYIAQDNPMRAVTFLREIRDQILALGRRPLLYRLKPELGEDARMAIVGRYVILFRLSRDAIRVERVAYGGAILWHSLRRINRRSSALALRCA